MSGKNSNKDRELLDGLVSEVPEKMVDLQKLSFGECSKVDHVLLE